jgi:hypothetical protein
MSMYCSSRYVRGTHIHISSLLFQYPDTLVCGDVSVGPTASCLYMRAVTTAGNRFIDYISGWNRAVTFETFGKYFETRCTAVNKTICQDSYTRREKRRKVTPIWNMYLHQICSLRCLYSYGREFHLVHNVWRVSKPQITRCIEPQD